MNIKEAIDVLERSCDFHYEETDKCYGCLFENSGWCGDDFHDSLLALLKEQEPVVPQKHYNEKADLLYACGKCHNDLKPNNRNAKFCWFCGTPVLWK